MWCIHTMDYYSALKRKGILAQATKRMNLGDIVLSEIACYKRTNNFMIPLT